MIQFNKQMLNTYYLLGTVHGAWDELAFFFLSFPQGAYILEEKDKHRKYKIYNVLEKKYSGQRNVTFFFFKKNLIV